MIASLRRKVSIYGAMAGIVPKMFMAWRAWFWTGMILNIMAMAITVFFWRAVYASTTTLGGLDLRQTLHYILLAQIFVPITEMFLVFEFGYNLREGQMAIALLRPVDFQGSYYLQAFANLIMTLIWQIPMAVVATLFFGLQWPSDPWVWGAFLVSAFLGRTVLFFFDWTLACITFYTTEVWGLGVLIEGLSAFFSGALLPLVMMPAWLQTVVHAVPFAQTLYVPMSLLTGIVPVADAPRLWLGQLAWIAALFVVSRLFFSVAVRKVTVQGG